MSIIIIADLFNLLCISSHLLCHKEHMVIFFLPSSYHSRTSHKHIHHIYPNKEDAGAKRSMLYTRVCVCVVCVCVFASLTAEMIACLMGPFSFFSKQN